MSTRSTCALPLLCLVQGCERFAYFAMLPLFISYLHHRHGFAEQSAMLLLGVFQALSYVGALPAGTVIDRRLGPVAALLLGASLLTLGYGALAVSRPVLLWPALGLMVLGHSFYKPSMGTLVGGLCAQDAARRERGFLLHHLATNIGAMAGPVCVEWARARNGWAGIFWWASVVMGLSTAIVAMARRWFVQPSQQRPSERTTTQDEAIDRDRLRQVWLICGAAVVFWLTAQQAGSSLVLFAEDHTSRHLTALLRAIVLGPGHFASLHSLLVLGLLPLFIVAPGWLRRRSSEP